VNAGDAARPTTSRAVVLERFGEPVVLREFRLPPAGQRGLLVAVRYGGICGTDLHLQQGHLDIPIAIVLGHEGLGTVSELGCGLSTDVNGAPLEVGDTVVWASSIACGICVPCRLHREPTLCEARRTHGVNRPTTQEPALSGSWAEHIWLGEGTVIIRVPEELDHLAAMSLACAGPTMVHALYERRPVRLGETVVVQGSGPVGLAAAALAQLAGAARVIIAGGLAGRLALAAAVGIGDHHVNVVDVAVPEQALDEVRDLTGGRGADLVIECTRVPEAIGQGLRLARRGGSYLVIGQYTDSGDVVINPHQIVYRQLDVIVSWAFTGSHLAHYIDLLPRLLDRFDLRRLVRVYPLADCTVAMTAVAARSVLKAVLTT
jgi:threonine dehydrogenase-like Zn-dependent dehydrogenase